MPELYMGVRNVSEKHEDSLVLLFDQLGMPEGTMEAEQKNLSDVLTCKY